METRGNRRPRRIAKAQGSLLVALASLGAMASPLMAQGTWTEVSNGGPLGRKGHAMAYDSQQNRSIMFGGRSLGGVSGILQGDTWSWNGSMWTVVSNTGPSPRADVAVAFDRIRGRLVLFGGFDGSRRGDTWELSAGTWIPQVFATGPQPRRNHAMAFDSSSGTVVLFGGEGTNQTHLSDTWTWNGTGWTQRSGSAPQGRQGHAMAFDPVRNRVVLVGGSYPAGALSSFLDDTWEWDGNAWQQVASGGIGPRSEHVMTYSSVHGGVLISGGQSPMAIGGDCVWDGSSWTLLTASGSGRGHAAIAFDEARNRPVIFGGEQPFVGTFLGTTIELVPPIGPGAPYGAGCGAPAPALAPDATSPPRIGTTARANLSALPTPVAVMMVGWSDTTFNGFTLPVSLAAIGMAGCDLLQSADVFGLPVAMTGSTTAAYSLSLPNDASLVNLNLYLQAVAYSPGSNQAELVVTNGLRWLVGY
jgi:hypothetical protein